MNRRYFLMSSAAVATAVRSSALASPNDTVRVACVGFNARGEAHLRAYPRIPNAEIVALARKYDRMVQHGAGGSGVMLEARQKMADGLIGEVYMARALVFRWRDTIGR